MLFTNAVNLAIMVITMLGQSSPGPMRSSVGDQTLHWYGLSNDAPAPVPAPLTKKDCGANFVNCSGKHQTSTISCQLPPGLRRNLSHYITASCVPDGKRRSVLHKLGDGDFGHVVS